MVKYHTIQITDDAIKIVEKERYFGSCPGCYAAGPVGKYCQNPHCAQGFRFFDIYARDKINPGSAIHRSGITYAPVMIPYDAEDHLEHGHYIPDMERYWYDPRNFILKAITAGSEIFQFDKDAMISNFASAIGIADTDSRELLKGFGVFDAEVEDNQQHNEQDEQKEEAQGGGNQGGGKKGGGNRDGTDAAGKKMSA